MDKPEKMDGHNCDHRKTRIENIRKNKHVRPARNTFLEYADVCNF